MDPFQGVNRIPQSLNKYTYTHNDPVNLVDPSGNFAGLAELSAVNSISSLMFNLQIEGSLHALDPLGVEHEALNAAKTASKAFSYAALGTAGFKIIQFFSKKLANCNSFTNETLVSLHDGYKPIDEVLIGDLIWAYNESLNQVELDEVTHLIKGSGLYSLVKLYTKDGEIIEATDNHLFYVEKALNNWTWLPAIEIAVGDLIKDAKGHGEKITNVEYDLSERQVYNLSVKNNHNYFVGYSELLAHNDGPCKFLHWSQNSLDHIFRGNSKGGFHHRSGGVNPSNARVLKVNSTVGSGKWKGAYEARVEICAKGDCFKKDSTFFPDSWPKSRVQAEVSSAYNRRLARNGGNADGVYVEKSANGFPVQLVVRNGELVTAFPKL